MCCGIIETGTMATVEQALARLQRSAFRTKFHLSEQDRQYIADKGMETIQRHAADFIRTRLAPASIPNDGKQTPMRGHPVFIAQHACACCCRGCLNKWYKVPKNKELSESQQKKIVNLLIGEYINFYNNYRIQTKTKLTPLEKRNQFVA